VHRHRPLVPERQGRIDGPLAARVQPAEEVRQLHETLCRQPVLQRRQARSKHAPEVGKVDRVRAKALHAVHSRRVHLGDGLR